ncbi:MAG: hypothetical protein COB35_05080 [Gammaproteobacteria bacterium]|nr:MAG: hypothetical protein COB35_05080 [Gammaproteobacteria bacterium]
MPQLVTYADARVLAQIDNTNALSQYVKAAVLPNAGAGNVLTELVTGVNYTYPNLMTWNADGSVSPNQNNAADYITLASSSGSVKMVTDDVIVIIDVDAIGAFGSVRTSIFNLSTYGTGINVTGGTWGLKGAESWFQLAYNNGRDATTAPGRNFIIFHWDHITQETRVYSNGTLNHTDTVGAISTNQTILGLSATRIGLGNSGNKFYSQSFLTKTGSFTAAEINEIVTNPYQIFKVAGAVTPVGTLAGSATLSITLNGQTTAVTSSVGKLSSSVIASSATTIAVNKSTGNATSLINSNGQIVSVDNLNGALALQVVIPGNVLTPKTIANAVLSAISASGLLSSSGLVNASILTSNIQASATTIAVNKSTGNATSLINSNGQIVSVDNLNGALALQVVIPGHVLTPKAIASAVLSAVSASGLLNSTQLTQGSSQLSSLISKASTTLITPTNSLLILDPIRLGKTTTIDYQNISVQPGSLIVQVLLSNEIIENLKSNHINI